jgi:quercetin dioxygenase-like cupin family protein
MLRSVALEMPGNTHKPCPHKSIKVLTMGAAYRFPSRRELSRMPSLAGTLMHFNLPEEVRQLRNQDSWRRGSGRSSKTLVKYPDFHLVLVVMRANTRMNEHHVDARISIHVLEGRIRIRMSGEVVEVSAGELVALDYAIPHDVEAPEESAFLLTISWPGGTKEERHAWKAGVL